VRRRHPNPQRTHVRWVVPYSLVVLEPACAAEGRVRLYVKVREIKEIHARSLS
jgi:hypothetical protein